jgi:hypothetical protein
MPLVKMYMSISKQKTSQLESFEKLGILVVHQIIKN